LRGERRVEERAARGVDQSCCLLLLLLLLQTYEALVRGKRRAEERAARAAEKAAKEESKRQEELRSYKGLMKVRTWGLGSGGWGGKGLGVD
jgi:hypothetical protein